MPSLEMVGPFKLSISVIDEKVGKNKIGNYALGYVSNDKIHFIVRYVGRSDSDLNQRLKDHVNESDEYQLFKFSYASSPIEAFKKECINFHDFGAEKYLDNKIHPDAPEGCGAICPICGLICKIKK